MAEETSVYLYYDARECLIYVGITGKGIGRQRQHEANAEWWPFVRRQEVEQYATREEAGLREVFLIRDHRPPFNRQHNPDWERLREAYLTLYGHTALRIPVQRAAPGVAEPPLPCGHCPGCVLNTMDLADEEPSRCEAIQPWEPEEGDDPPETCAHCGSRTCLFLFGAQEVGPDAWQQGYHAGRDTEAAAASWRHLAGHRRDIVLSHFVDKVSGKSRSYRYTWTDTAKSWTAFSERIANGEMAAMVEAARDPWSSDSRTAR